MTSHTADLQQIGWNKIRNKTKIDDPMSEIIWGERTPQSVEKSTWEGQGDVVIPETHRGKPREPKENDDTNRFH